MVDMLEDWGLVAHAVSSLDQSVEKIASSHYNFILVGSHGSEQVDKDLARQLRDVTGTELTHLDYFP